MLISALKYLHDGHIKDEDEQPQTYQVNFGGVTAKTPFFSQRQLVHLPLGSQILVKVIQQQGDTVPLHLAALVVKVEMMVLDLSIVQIVDVLLECNAHGSFVSLLVDEVDNQLWSIELFLGLKVLTE